MSEVKHRIIQKTKTETAKAKSEGDWIAQELAEDQPVPRTGDNINDAIGRQIYMARATYPGWISPKTKKRLAVTRFYFHDPKVIVDMPHSEAELEDKADFFKTGDVAYVALAPRESLTPEQLRARIYQAINATAKRNRPASKVTNAAEPQAPAPAQKTPQNGAQAQKKASKKATRK